MLFLVMVRVVAVFSTQDYRTCESGVPELAVRAFTTRHSHKSRGFQLGNQLADLSRHDAALFLYSTASGFPSTAQIPGLIIGERKLAGLLIVLAGMVVGQGVLYGPCCRWITWLGRSSTFPGLFMEMINVESVIATARELCKDELRKGTNYGSNRTCR
jgi:hypothetical protein